MSALDDAIAALNAERYGTGHWFKTLAPAPVNDDSDTTTARRRRDLLAAVEIHYAKEA